MAGGYIPYGWKNGFRNVYGIYGNKEEWFVCKAMRKIK